MTDITEVREFWEKRTEQFKEKAPVHIGKGRIYNKLMTRTHRKELAKAFDTCKPESVLEIGVGQGRLLSTIVGVPGFGIDLSLNMLKNCKRKVPDNIELIQAEATHLPFKEDSFGLVYTCTVLLHIPKNSVEPAVSEIKRVARKNIFIVEQLPNFQHIDTCYSKGGYCFPHNYEDLFQLQIKYRKKLKSYGHEAMLFYKNSNLQRR
jgi:ubiquinone/menaquinone biosynthesis C-methylase UbiE